MLYLDANFMIKLFENGYYDLDKYRVKNIYSKTYFSDILFKEIYSVGTLLRINYRINRNG